MVYEFNGPFTPRSISSTPPTLFPANSTRRASVCSPPRNQEPSPDSPGPSGAQSTPRSWSIYGLATASLDTSSGSGELEQESSRDGGDDLGRLKKDRSSLEWERNHLRGKTGYAVGDFVGVKEREEQQRDLGMRRSDGQCAKVLGNLAMRIGAEELILYSSTDIELHLNLHACMDGECFIYVALICLGCAYG
ncbi:hypothetical protein LWI28_003929 [Acer negundo]|uniref:Uncharacterized protein n=1 Tax=Acer negundo TaxID=4023 RepID=A0AAD5ICS8_ACENE|nr:hypothetical protein LWI28_003929 [Acer negundo]